MRPQQRSFVIEYKSSRRQPAKQARSIWGDTNFEALAKEAEIDAPQLFQPNSAHVPDLAAPEIAPAEAVLPEIVECESPAPQATISIDSTEVELQNQEPAAAKLPEPRKKSAGNTRNNRSQRRPVRSSAPRPEYLQAAEGDLSALEAENRELRGQLAEQLARQNARLKEMLRRFETA